VETDLWLTQDRVLVCHHDRTLDRTTDGTGAIPQRTLSEIKGVRVLSSYCGSFDASRYPDERIPTLEELLAYLPEEVGLSLELKDPTLVEPERARQLVDTIRPRIKAGTVLLLSFHTALLRAAQRADPQVWIGKIDMFRPIPWFRGNGIGTTWPAMRLNPLYVRMARALKLWVCPLDPEPEERLPRYLRMGVDAVLTHDPAKTIGVLNGLQATRP
jgi:glycerophosphoryl diester phosphodiesterase